MAASDDNKDKQTTDQNRVEEQKKADAQQAALRAQIEAEIRAQLEAEAQAQREAQARREAEANTFSSTTVPGGRYRVGKYLVDANGQRIKE